MKKYHYIIICCLTLFSFTGYSQKAIDLKFNLPKGATYNYNMDVDMAVKGTAEGQEVNVTNTMGMGYSFEVLDDSAGWKKISATLSKIAMDMSTAGVTIHYNSDEPVDTSNFVNMLFGQIFGAMKGSKFSFIMNGKGDIADVKGIEEMVNRMSEAVPEAGGGMSDGIGDAFNEESFAKNLQQVFGAYPGKPVKPGDSWASAYTTVSNGINMNMANTYTLESVSNGIANVKVDSKITAADTTMPLNGTSAGVLKYDVATGVPVDGNLALELKMDAGEGAEASPMDVVIKTKITGKK